MTAEAKADIDLIEQTIRQEVEQPEPEPRVKVRPTGKRPAPVPMIEADDFDDDSDAIADDGADLVNVPVVISPPRALVGEGLPDLEAVPGVQAARAAEVEITEKRRALAAAKAFLLTELKLPANATERDLDKRHVALIVAGADETEIEKLRAAYKREQLLAQAASEAAGATQRALQQARNALAEQAEATLYVPALRDAAVKYLDFLQASEQVRAVAERLRRAGMRRVASAIAPGMIPSDLSDRGSIWHICGNLIDRGALSREEVEAAIPGVMPR